MNLAKLITVSLVASAVCSSCCSLCFDKADIKPTSKINSAESSEADPSWEAGISGSIEWGKCQDESTCRALKRMAKVIEDAKPEVDAGTMSIVTYQQLYESYVKLVELAAISAINTTGKIPQPSNAPGSGANELSQDQQKALLGAQSEAEWKKFEGILKANNIDH